MQHALFVPILYNAAFINANKKKIYHIIENETIIVNLKDPGSPVLIRDLSDKNSFHVVMPMKI